MHILLLTVIDPQLVNKSSSMRCMFKPMIQRAMETLRKLLKILGTYIYIDVYVSPRSWKMYAALYTSFKHRLK